MLSLGREPVKQCLHQKPSYAPCLHSHRKIPAIPQNPDENHENKMIVPPDVQLKNLYPIRIRRKMQKEILKRKPEYAISIRVIEERRSDVPLKPHRRKFPSFGSGKIAGSDIRESSTVIRPSVIFLFPILFAAV